MQVTFKSKYTRVRIQVYLEAQPLNRSYTITESLLRQYFANLKVVCKRIKFSQQCPDITRYTNIAVYMFLFSYLIYTSMLYTILQLLVLRFAMGLRFLATGDSFKSLKYSFRVLDSLTSHCIRIVQIIDRSTKRICKGK